jgi:hypothetical protein
MGIDVFGRTPDCLAPPPSQKGPQMDALQNIMILLIAGTVIWMFLKLKERIEFLEHEVRWLRSELDGMKGVHRGGDYD